MVDCPDCGSELEAVRSWSPAFMGIGENNLISNYVCRNKECHGWYCDYCEEWQPFGTSCAVAMVRNVRSDTNYQTVDLRGRELYRRLGEKVNGQT